jgi:hypothetical protein
MNHARNGQFENIRASNTLSLVFECSTWTNVKAVTPSRHLVMAWCVVTLRRFPSMNSFEIWHLQKETRCARRTGNVLILLVFVIWLLSWGLFMANNLIVIHGEQPHYYSWRTTSLLFMADNLVVIHGGQPHYYSWRTTSLLFMRDRSSLVKSTNKTLLFEEIPRVGNTIPFIGKLLRNTFWWYN